jgi:hypothetical protein
VTAVFLTTAENFVKQTSGSSSSYRPTVSHGYPMSYFLPRLFHKPVFTFCLGILSGTQTLYQQESLLSEKIATDVCATLPGRRRSEDPIAQIVSSTMQDMTMLFLTALFFGVAFLYVKALQKLR